MTLVHLEHLISFHFAAKSITNMSKSKTMMTLDLERWGLVMKDPDSSQYLITGKGESILNVAVNEFTQEIKARL